MGFIKRWWTGQERLWKVFWGFGLMEIVGGSVGEGYAKIIQTAPLSVIRITFPFLLLITVALITFGSVSVWRCAFNVKRRAWGYIARVLAVIGAIGAAANLLLAFMEFTKILRMSDLILVLLVAAVMVVVLVLAGRIMSRPYTRTEVNELKPGLLKDMLDHGSHINDYFANAVRVWLFRQEDSAHLAALSAAKVAASLQRASMVTYLSAMADELSESTGTQEKALIEKALRIQITSLAREITEKDWDLDDVREAKRQLAAADSEYAEALDGADPKVFERRHPSLFRRLG